MANVSPQSQNFTRPPPTSHSTDEYSPLLQKTSNDGHSDPTVSEQNVPASTGKALESNSVLWIMISVWIGTFTAGLDGTVMATLAAPIATSFNSLSLLAWLATAFLIGQAATQPLSGKLTDIFSRQWGLVVSNCFFALGNLICGLSNGQWTMVIGRVLAGVGGGCLNSISTIIVSDLIPLRQRALWQGMSNVFWGLGNGLGGLFGGYMNDTWNWRVAFLAQVPLTAACASSTQAGNALVPIGVTLPIGSLLAGYITSRTGRYKYVLWATLLLLVIGTVANCTDSLSTPLWLPTTYLVLVGLGMGGMLVVTLVAFTSAVKVSEQALVTSLSYVFRSTGSVMGVAIGSAVYQGVLESNLWSRIGNIENAADVIRGIKDSLDQIEILPEQLQKAVRGSYMVALRATFSTTVGFAMMAVVSGLLVRELKLHSTLTREGEDTIGKQDGRDAVGPD
ncbi:MAG: hypothetical protein Q9209_001240 [Squamulea sp. 1 TL-2023]